MQHGIGFHGVGRHLALCPGDIDATVGWSTVSGEVECEGTQTGARSIRFGTGLTPVKLTTVSGDIEIRKL